MLIQEKWNKIADEQLRTNPEKNWFKDYFLNDLIVKTKYHEKSGIWCFSQIGHIPMKHMNFCFGHYYETQTFQMGYFTCRIVSRSLQGKVWVLYNVF